MLNKLKLTLFTALLILFMFFFTDGVDASDASIACDSGGCSGLSGALFNEANLTPGASVSKTLSATNNYSEARIFSVEINSASFSDSSPSIADELTVTVKDNSDLSILYGSKTLTEWKDDGFVNLTSIDPGNSKEFLFVVSFADVGNLYQGLSINFDLNFGFDEISDSSSQNSGSNTSGNTNSSSGQVLGASTDNTSGNVLGLSFTGQGILSLIVFLFGVILALFGSLILIKSIRMNASDN